MATRAEASERRPPSRTVLALAGGEQRAASVRWESWRQIQEMEWIEEVGDHSREWKLGRDGESRMRRCRERVGRRWCEGEEAAGRFG